MIYNDVWIKFLAVDILFCYILMTWNIYECMYIYVHCDEIKDLLLLLLLTSEMCLKFFFDIGAIDCLNSVFVAYVGEAV